MKYLLMVLMVSCFWWQCAAQEAEKLQIKIPAFKNQRIPPKFTCDGDNLSPAVYWSGEPKGTRSYVLTCVDLDAPGGEFVHWMVYNIPSESNHLTDALSRDATLPNGALQGRNSFNRLGYDGPCPPPGKEHRYVFSLFALDVVLNLRTGASESELQKAMKGHVVAKAETQGTFEVKKGQRNVALMPAAFSVRN